MIKNISKKEFKAEIESGVVLVDFYADWCMPCKMFDPVLKELAAKYTAVHFRKVNVNNEMEITTQYNVMSIPCIIIFKNGKEIERFDSAITKEFLDSQIKKAVSPYG